LKHFAHSNFKLNDFISILDINVYNSEGLSAFHILLVKLMDLATYEMLPISSRDVPLTDDLITAKMIK